MRIISDDFMENLLNGFLSRLREQVAQDVDLDLHIRENYINIYYKGNSLLKLTEKNSQSYQVEIHDKFLGGKTIPDLVDVQTTKHFLDLIPRIKENIINHGRYSLEIEYEQLIIRANNNERRNNSEYFIIDRQFMIGMDRIDLLGMFWDRTYRRKGQTVIPCFFEIKFALNPDLGEVHNQIARYYGAVKPIAEQISNDAQMVFRQRLDLGLYDQSQERISAMKTLNFSPNIDEFQFILVLVDYNPNSRKLDLSTLANLPFVNQVKVFYTGFAMWRQNFSNLIIPTN